jgi:hypothetical protein
MSYSEGKRRIVDNRPDAPRHGGAGPVGNPDPHQDRLFAQTGDPGRRLARPKELLGALKPRPQRFTGSNQLDSLTGY